MSQRIALLLSYDGRHLSGWQIQPSDRTVQGILEDTLSSVARIPVRIMGAGRTDAGVSAWGQVAHADLPIDFPIPIERLPRIINSRLPQEIRILNARPVSLDFHARHRATAKIYKYSFRTLPEFLTHHPVSDPFSTPIRPSFDLARAMEAGKHFLGRHDFRHFSVTSSLPPDPVRTISDLYWESLPTGAALWITGPGFLHRMVRMIGGFLRDVGEGRRSATEISPLLRTGSPPPFRSIEPLPPEGLCLVRVLYGREDPFDPRFQTCYSSRDPSEFFLHERTP